MMRCWECETEAVRTVEVALPVSGAGSPVLSLCLPCYQHVCIPLVAQLMSADTPHQRRSESAEVGFSPSRQA
jgi:hypothetical protein